MRRLMIFDNQTQQRRGGFSPPWFVTRAMGAGKRAPLHSWLYLILKHHKPAAKFKAPRCGGGISEVYSPLPLREGLQVAAI
jgi:hypothetical protein